MDLPLLIILFFFLLFMLTHNLPSISSAPICSISKCGDSSTLGIRFPFRLTGSGVQPEPCGYPGFNVSCDPFQQTLIDLPSSSGSFIIKSIDYVAQEIWVNDPNNCLPKRLLNNSSFNLSGSPFTGIYYQEFSFFNCSTSLVITKTNATTHLHDLIIGPISCLSHLQNHFVYAIPSTNNSTFTKCHPLALGVKVPVQWPLSVQNQTGLGSSPSTTLDLNDDLRLTWFKPECRQCESKGQMCGLKTNSSGSTKDDYIICSNMPNQGQSGKLAITTFVAVILVVCAPMILCLLGSLCIWIRSYHRLSPTLPLQNELIVTPRPGHLVRLGIEEAGVEFARQVAEMGLSGQPNPQSRPKIVECLVEELGPTREDTCPICMSEYRPKDRIGTLPTCGHYFHAKCIDKWLLSRGIIDKTCPICRARVNS